MKIIQNSILFVSYVILVEGFLCPSNIHPCTCTADPSGDFIACSGTEVDQSHVNNLFTSLRHVNNLTSNDWLQLDSIYLEQSKMTELDLTPLKRTRIHSLFLRFNLRLSNLAGPNLNDSDNHGIVDVTSLYLTHNALTDAGLGESLKYFVGSSLLTVDIARNSLMASVTRQVQSEELLPGLSAFTNLEKLVLGENFIELIGGGSFKKNNRLKELYLNWNQIEEIQENSFDLGETPSDLINSSLWVDLHLNQRLSDKLIHPNHGLDKLPRQVTFYLDYTNLETLPKVTFEKFLEKEGNVLMVWMTPIFCDGKVKWLKERKDEFQYSVVSPNCANDVGQTVFTSDLVN